MHENCQLKALAGTPLVFFFFVVLRESEKKKKFAARVCCMYLSTECTVKCVEGEE